MPRAQGSLILNENLAKQLVEAANWVKMQSDEGEINPVDILRWPGVMAAQEQDLDAITAEILPLLMARWMILLLPAKPKVRR
ncbi:YicC-like family, N-terminal region [Cedecea neteri]|uniref:YicC-like family, N-terminal region n=1 Tax=Cedecea neteri TaxID=158822 RepID=A0A2X2TD18_9ENTR|nr:YicC-like family, N-terminal region [Cedecea neteri]